MRESKNLGFELKYWGWVFNYFYHFSHWDCPNLLPMKQKEKNKSEQSIFYQQ